MLWGARTLPTVAVVRVGAGGISRECFKNVRFVGTGAKANMHACRVYYLVT
jgi:hypothetical protein